MENETLYDAPADDSPVSAKTTPEHLRAPVVLALDGEEVQLRTHLGIGLKIERKTKVPVMDFLTNMDRISLDQALSIVAIAADRDTDGFKDRILRTDDYVGLMEIAGNVLLGIAFPGDLEAAEAKLDKFSSDEYTKNEIRAKLGIPLKDLTGRLY